MKRRHNKFATLTLEDVRSRVEALRGDVRDPETAHVIEDEIHVAVLRAIAAGTSNPRKLAAEALETLKIQFPRWCG